MKRSDGIGNVAIRMFVTLSHVTYRKNDNNKEMIDWSLAFRLTLYVRCKHMTHLSVTCTMHNAHYVEEKKNQFTFGLSALNKS